MFLFRALQRSRLDPFLFPSSHRLHHNRLRTIFLKLTVSDGPPFHLHRPWYASGLFIIDYSASQVLEIPPLVYYENRAL